MQMEVNMTKITQCERIIKYMQDFGSISSLEAMRDLGVMRLASRITDLKDSGYIIDSRFESRKNRYGQAVSYKRYFLHDTTKGDRQWQM